MTAIRESGLPDLIHRGKVRDTHEMNQGMLLMVTTDRISAFDVVLPTAIPDKGAVLCQLSAYWFEQTSNIVPNHFVELATTQTESVLPTEIKRRSMVVHKAERIDVECVVRGYITGSAWLEYKKSGTVGGLPVSKGFKEGDRFPEPVFTPTTKADMGHDENMSIKQVEDMVGKETADSLAKHTIAVYNYAHDLALPKGIIIADTKMEFGHIRGELSLIDELLTPDSSRFWDASSYEPGKSQPNFDKQFVRDWLDSQGWDHEPPPPDLPVEVVNKTRQRYLEAHQKLTGNGII